VQNGYRQPARRLREPGGNGGVSSRPTIGRRACFTGSGECSEAAFTHPSACFDDMLIVQPEWACDCSPDNAIEGMFAESGRMARYKG